MWRNRKARWPQWLMLAIAAGLAAVLLRGLFYARTFPLVHDAAIMRYVVFMIDRGHAPYTQMLEMNLPGALMSEWFGVHVFGADAAGLWRWDTFIGLMVATAAISIAGRGFRAAGACGAMLAWLLHLNDGALMFGERDWLIAALLLLGAACATQALRSYQPMWMAGAVAFAGWATTIKPFAVLVPMALLVLALWSFRLRKQRAAVIAWAAAGAAIPMLAVLLYSATGPEPSARFSTRSAPSVPGMEPSAGCRYRRCLPEFCSTLPSRCLPSRPIFGSVNACGANLKTLCCRSASCAPG